MPSIMHRLGRHVNYILQCRSVSVAAHNRCDRVLADPEIACNPTIAAPGFYRLDDPGGQSIRFRTVSRLTAQFASARAGCGQAGFDPFAEQVPLELGDAREQRARFEADLAERRARQRPQRPADEHFLSALAAGLPACAGVALGFDRVVMTAAGASCIDDVVTFPLRRA